MVKDARKQQKKLERKRKKQKAEKKELARQQNQGLAVQMQHASTAPVLHCCVATDLQDEGMGQVLVSRRCGPSQVASAVFLVDRYCLGVKGCFGHIMSASEYRERIYDRLQQRFQMNSIDLETAFLIVQGSVDYARQFSLAPHADYRKLSPIFGAPDVTGREPPIEFGQEGKPFYIRGPHETPEEARRIVGLLRDACGDEGFHYLLLAHDLDLDDLVGMVDETEGADADSRRLGPPNPPQLQLPGR